MRVTAQGQQQLVERSLMIGNLGSHYLDMFKWSLCFSLFLKKLCLIFPDQSKLTNYFCLIGDLRLLDDVGLISPFDSCCVHQQRLFGWLCVKRYRVRGNMSGTLTQYAWVHVCACVCVFYSRRFRCEKENNMFPTHPITHTMHAHAYVVSKEIIISVVHLCCLSSGSKPGYRTEHWVQMSCIYVGVIQHRATLPVRVSLWET